MLETVLDILTAILLVYLLIFLFLRVRMLKEFKERLHVYFLCDNIALAYSKKKNLTFYENKILIANGYYLNISGVVCRIPRICNNKSFIGKGKIKVIVRKNCIEFEVV